MKRNILILLTCLFSFATMMQADTENIRIMTFNIPYGNVNTETNTWAKRLEKITEYFKSTSPDLIGMQEPVRAELVQLLRNQPGYTMLGVTADDGAETGGYDAIVYKNSRLRVDAYGNYYLTSTPTKKSKVDGSTHYRIATWALFTDKQTGARFLYTNTHLSYDSEECRLKQIEYLKTNMYSISQKYGESLPHLLTGDLNMTMSEDNYNYVKNYKMLMNDMWYRATKRVHLSPTQERNRIDYIFGTKNISCTYSEWSSRYTDDGYEMSDHSPLYADVYWNTTDEDDARAAVRTGWEVIDSTYTHNYLRTNLLTAASQVSTDGLESSYSTVANIMDQKTSTFIHSLYSSTAKNQPHYLQVKLNKTISGFRFSYCRRDGSDGLKDCWQDVMIQASNDGSTWDYITTLNDFCGCTGKTDVKSYTSDNIPLYKPYTYIRFSVLHTPGMEIRNANPEYSLSELQIYESTISSSSQRFTDDYMSDACDAVEILIGTTEKKIAAGIVSADDVTDLRKAIKVLRDTRDGGPDGIDSLTPALSKGEGEAIYNLAGQCVSTSAGSTTSLPRGLNIVRRADGKIYKVLK